jgi:hypothetical protein
MKFYNLLLEILDDSVFKQKLNTMPKKSQEKVIALVEKLSESNKKEFKSLLNKYSSVSQLKAPQSTLEKELGNLFVKGENIGPGEVLFHLQLKNSSMVGDTTHDLTVGSEVYEVKRVGSKGGPFRSGKKGKISQFKFSSDLAKIVTVINQISKRLPKVEDDIKDISPKLYNVLSNWNKNISQSYTPQGAILAGELSQKFRNYMVKAIDIIKQEVEKNTDDEFTTVKFGGVNISPKNKGIDPVKIDKIDGDKITLDFIGNDILNFLQILNELPYLREGDFLEDIEEAVNQILSQLPSLIIYSINANKLVVIPKDRIKEEIELDSISQGEIRFKVKNEFWK